MGLCDIAGIANYWAGLLKYHLVISIENFDYFFVIECIGISANIISNTLKIHIIEVIIHCYFELNINLVCYEKRSVYHEVLHAT